MEKKIKKKTSVSSWSTKSLHFTFIFILTHHHLLMVLKLQAKVVALDEVHVGAHQVKQHLARGFLL